MGRASAGRVCVDLGPFRPQLLEETVEVLQPLLERSAKVTLLQETAAGLELGIAAWCHWNNFSPRSSPIRAYHTSDSHEGQTPLEGIKPAPVITALWERFP